MPQVARNLARKAASASFWQENGFLAQSAAWVSMASRALSMACCSVCALRFSRLELWDDDQPVRAVVDHARVLLDPVGCRLLTRTDLTHFDPLPLCEARRLHLVRHGVRARQTGE